mgnify:CR=1 FL=1
MPVTVKLPVNVSVVLSKYDPVAPLSDEILLSLVFTLPAIEPEKLVIDPDISDAFCAEDDTLSSGMLSKSV